MSLRKILLSIPYCFFLGLIISSGCKNANEQAISKDSIIAGKIINFNSKEHPKYIKFHFTEPIDDDLSIICEIDSNGNFKLAIERPYPQDYFLEYGCLNQLYTYPGDSLFIEIDTRFLGDSDSIPFKTEYFQIYGESARINTEVFKYHRFFESEMINWELHFEAIREMKPMEYRSYISTRTELFNTLNSRFNESNAPSDDFLLWQENHLKYRCYSDLLEYRVIHPMMHGIIYDKYGVLDFDIPSNYFNFLEDIDFEDAGATKCSQYFIFLNNYSSYIGHDLLNHDTLVESFELFYQAKFTDRYKIFQRHIISNTYGFLEDFLLANLYSSVLTNEGLDVYDSVSRNHQVRDPILSNILEKKLQILMGDHLISKVEEEFRNPDLAVFDSIIALYQGKVIYVDFWAPWCSPCMGEMPQSIELQKEYEAKNIVFLYLACLCTEESWETTIEDKGIKGAHFLLTDNQYNAIFKKYELSGIPKHLLINKKGELYDKNAPSPREKVKLRSLINNLLSE